MTSGTCVEGDGYETLPAMMKAPLAIHTNGRATTLLTSIGILLVAYGIAIGQAFMISFAIIGMINDAGPLGYWMRPQSPPLHRWFEDMNQMLGACAAAIGVAGAVLISVRAVARRKITTEQQRHRDTQRFRLLKSLARGAVAIIATAMRFRILFSNVSRRRRSCVAKPHAH